MNNEQVASLIISVYDNVDNLKVVLDNLKYQTNKRFEIIISEDAEHERMQEFLAGYQSPFPIYHLTQHDNGWNKNRALNQAAMYAKTDYLIFIDGDCVLHPRFIEFHLKKANKNCFVAGKRIKLDKVSTEWLMQSEANFLNFPKYLIRNYIRMRRNGALFMEEGFFFAPETLLGIIPKLRRMSHLKGCNMSFPKEALLAINGFDEDYVKPAVGEDADIQWRLQNAGYKLTSVRNLAVQYHLYHKESWRNQDDNLALMRQKQEKNQFVCLNGIRKMKG
ncbi:MAG: glycosyltransferase [Bacteroidales bacterium]